MHCKILMKIFTLAIQEFCMISSIVEALNPFGVAVEALCWSDTNLLEEIIKSHSHYHPRFRDAIDD